MIEKASLIELTQSVRTALGLADQFGLLDVGLHLNEALVLLDGVGDAGEAGIGISPIDRITASN
jgi:hypothetical protein